MTIKRNLQAAWACIKGDSVVHGCIIDISGRESGPGATFPPHQSNPGSVGPAKITARPGRALVVIDNIFDGGMNSDVMHRGAAT